MRLLPNIGPNTTAAKLDGARGSLLAAQARIDQLVADRAVKIAADGDIGEVQRIDLQLEQDRGQISALTERIAGLESRQAAEAQVRRESEHRQAIERFSQTLAPIHGAAEEIEDAIKKLSAAVNKYQSAAGFAAGAWPPGIVPWNSDHLAGGRLGQLLQEALAPGGLCRRRGSDIVPGPAASEFTDMASTAAERSAGFARGEQQHHDALMKDLRSQSAPEEPALVEDAA